MADAQFQRAMSLQQAGRFEEAASLYQQILRANPLHFEALYSLAMVYLQTERPEDAQRTFAAALKLNPRFVEGFCARGLVLLQLQRRDEAILCFDKALAIRPDFIDALSSRATALLESDRLEEAVAEFDRVLALKPDHAISWNNRGNAFVAMRRHQEAVVSFDRALAIRPDLTTAENNRALALLELKQVSRIPAHAVRLLFDDYASYYDQAMLGGLSYRAPEHLRHLLGRILPGVAAPLSILDLGCGTGLSGEAFQDLAAGGRLDGVDLSPLMIEQARARGIYGELIVGDFESTFAGEGPAYDLVIAADAFSYHGDLVPALLCAARRLMAGGFCLFTVEKLAEGSWEQTPANRFRHSESYLHEAAARAGLEFAHVMECPLRSESGEPVEGFAVALRKGSGPTSPFSPSSA